LGSLDIDLGLIVEDDFHFGSTIVQGGTSYSFALPATYYNKTASLACGHRNGLNDDGLILSLGKRTYNLWPGGWELRGRCHLNGYGHQIPSASHWHAKSPRADPLVQQPAANKGRRAEQHDNNTREDTLLIVQGSHLYD
jgi:hypothetical protein